MHRAAALALLALLASACVQQMDHQPRYRAFDASGFFADGSAMRPALAGTVARDEAPASPPPVTPGLLATGRTRYEINCAPCHGLAGDGDGVIVQHGFPAPPSFHEARLVAAPEGHYFDVITHGYGVMYPYAGHVRTEERWAIIAYIRALQLARHGTLADVPPQARPALEGGTP
jgi:mono/diheme cytochrome c family protein